MEEDQPCRAPLECMKIQSRSDRRSEEGLDSPRSWDNILHHSLITPSRRSRCRAFYLIPAHNNSNPDNPRCRPDGTDGACGFFSFQ